MAEWGGGQLWTHPGDPARLVVRVAGGGARKPARESAEDGAGAGGEAGSAETDDDVWGRSGDSLKTRTGVKLGRSTRGYRTERLV